MNRCRPRFCFLLVTVALSILGYGELAQILHSQKRQKDQPILNPPRRISLRDCYQRNQQTRTSVISWISRDNWQSPPSLFNYGLPDKFFFHVNLDVGSLPIGHDLLSFIGTQLRLSMPTTSRLNFLEIGVSVGKCLLTQLEFFGESALVVAFDIEDINPSFANMLVPDISIILDNFTEESLVPGVTSLRRQPGSEKFDTIKQFFSPSGGELRYLSTDEFNIAGWEHLQKQGIVFELIYSDAFHQPSALIYEAEQLLLRGLINLNDFAIVWDDCGGEVLMNGVCPVIELLSRIKRIPALTAGIFKIGGWLGVHEELHSTCIVSTLPLLKLWTEDDFLSSRPLTLLREVCTGKN
jgi:hypothetical protein